MNTPKIFVGSAGWSYKDWMPNFYPRAQSKNFSWLHFYSNYFKVVEVNSSYYTYISPNMVNNWLQQIEQEQEFLFTVKLHKDFTHKRYYGKNEISAVKTNLDILKEAERFGGLLIQFPYSFQYTSSNVEYLQKIIHEFEGYNQFVEVRHKSWQHKNAKTVTMCTIDQPQIGESYSFNPIIGNQTAYVRFHGRNVEAWKDSLNNFSKDLNYETRSARYEYLYSPGELIEIDQKIKEIFDKVKKIFVIMNNHPHGDAIANAFELLYLLKERTKIKIPPTILTAYPRLKTMAEVEKLI